LEKQDHNQASEQAAPAEQPIQAEAAPLEQPLQATVQSETPVQPEQPKPDPQAEQAELAADAQDTEAQAAEKQKRNLALMEAALFVAGRPLDLNELCQVINSRSKKKAKKFADLLIQEYLARGSPMEILALKDERYVLQVKAEFTPLIKKLVNRPLLSSGPLKTLSYIAFRQPISQKRVVETRGQHAYGHVKLLKDMGLIASERLGRSMALRTTDYFADYFGLTQDTSLMKRELRRIFGDALKDDGQP
jgi:segregation and condensation protein B